MTRRNRKKEDSRHPQIDDDFEAEVEGLTDEEVEEELLKRGIDPKSVVEKIRQRIREGMQPPTSPDNGDHLEA